MHRKFYKLKCKEREYSFAWFLGALASIPMELKEGKTLTWWSEDKLEIQ